jgi:hypothetical protein
VTTPQAQVSAPRAAGVCAPNVHQRQHLLRAREADDVVRRRIEALARHLSTARDLLYIHAGSAYDHVERAQNLAAALLDEASTVASPSHELDDLDAAEPLPTLPSRSAPRPTR